MHSQVIGFLGEALARMTAIQAMEEYGVSQYASSIQFINKLITAARWASILPCSFLFFAYMLGARVLQYDVLPQMDSMIKLWCV
jgi:hypothetical protein